ncbi:hypothetical protein HA402_002417 [Bradysia odoriphaga]|nr:hypothetical protein HA402_002417 [Bradysia odoriphaga]
MLPLKIFEFRFHINNGEVTYQCRFIQTETFKKNMIAKRIVVTEFGTSSVPDPCQNIFQRFSSRFKATEKSDNTMVSIYPFGDEYYSFTESPVIHRINIETLKTEARVSVSDFVGIVSHTSHPHVLPNGTVKRKRFFLLHILILCLGPRYNIICFPNGKYMFDNAHIVASIPSRWKFFPSYMHTFSMTDNYFVIVEQPLSVSLPSLVKSNIKNEPIISSFKWFADAQTFIYLICRKRGQLCHTYKTDPIFYLHIINSYEDNGHVILDICTYKDPSMLDCMYIESMRDMQNNPNYANMFRARPLRFVLPLHHRHRQIQKTPFKRSLSLMNVIPNFNTNRRLCKSTSFDFGKDQQLSTVNYQKLNFHSENLVKLKGTTCASYLLEDSTVFCEPESLCSVGCETPRIHYDSYSGKKYRYFYAISADLDAPNPGTLIKVDVVTKTKLMWCEPNCYPSEPIFVAAPNCQSEDDGVVLASMVWGKTDENRVGLLVLCAKTWTQIGRCEFITKGPVPKCLHGWFASEKK